MGGESELKRLASLYGAVIYRFNVTRVLLLLCKRFLRYREEEDKIQILLAGQNADPRYMIVFLCEC